MVEVHHTIRFTDDEARLYWLWVLQNEEKSNEMIDESLTFLFSDDSGFYITNNETLDWFLWYYCELDFIQTELKRVYEDKPPINKLREVVEDMYEAFGWVKADEYMKRLGKESYSFLFTLLNRVDGMNKK